MRFGTQRTPDTRHNENQGRGSVQLTYNEPYS